MKGGDQKCVADVLPVVVVAAAFAAAVVVAGWAVLSALATGCS